MTAARARPAAQVLWESGAAPEPVRPALTGERRCDVAIVGGGISGLSAALHLGERGVVCAVLERGRIGDGASGRNNGQVIPGLKIDPHEVRARFGPLGEAVLSAAAGAADLVFALIERHGIACQAERRGWLRAAHSAAALRALEGTARQWSDLGAPVELLDARRSAEVLGSPAYQGGMVDRRAGRLDPLAFTRGLARAAEAGGARLYTDSPALRIERTGGAWAVLTPQGRLRAERVLLATGAYGEALWPRLNASFFTVQSVQIASEPLPEGLRAALMPGVSAMSDTRKLSHAARLDRDGRIILAGRGPLDGRVTAGVERFLAAAAGRLFPALRAVRWSHAWSGRIAITLDHLPHLCELAPGVLSVVGYNGRGVAMASAMGRILAAQMTDAAACYPVRALRAIPLHGLRVPVLAAGVAYYRLRDGLGLASR